MTYITVRIRTCSAGSGRPAVGRVEADGQRQAERAGEAFQQRQGGSGATGLEAGDAGLGHPGPLGELALGPAEFFPPSADGLGQLVAQPGLFVGSGRFRAMDAGLPGLGKADTPRGGLAHLHPSSSSSSSSSAVWPSRWQRAIAAAALVISAVSRILVLVNTVSMMIRRPGAIQ